MRTATRIILGLVPPVGLFGAYAVWTADSTSVYFPAVTEIASRFRELWLFDGMMTDVVPSLRNLALGLLCAWVVGIPVGALLGRIRTMGDMFSPLLDFGRSVPPIMLIPPLVLVLGIGDASKVAIIAIGAFFPLCVATMAGMKQADTTLLDAARAVKLSPFQTLTTIYIPSGSPAILGGIQVSLQVGFVLTVASEMLAAYRGMGFVTMQAQLSFDSVTMWAGIVLLALLGYLTNTAFVVVRNRILSWHTGMRVARAAT